MVVWVVKDTEEGSVFVAATRKEAKAFIAELDDPENWRMSKQITYYSGA